MKIDKNNINKNDPAVRKALMDTYHEKCFYSGYPIDYSELEVDHIIPISIDMSLKNNREYLKSVGRDKSFQLNSVYNLVPVKFRINREKSNDLFTPDYAKYLLDRAARNADKVLKNIKKYKQKKSYSRHMEAVRTLTYKDDKKAAELYDFFVDDMEDFVEEGPKYMQFVFFISTPKVRLQGSLPKYSALQGSCILTFRSLKIRNCEIEVSHEEIMSQLFVGMNTQPELKLRGFIDTVYESEDIYSIRIGKVQFSLTLEEVNQLCKVIDFFGKAYLKELRKLEGKLGTYLFEESKNRKNSYRLLKIKRTLWGEMIDFACAHDYDNGNSEWHMFQDNGKLIHVNTKFDNQKYDSGTHVKLYPEQEDSLNLRHPDEDVWVIWEPPHSVEFESILNNVNKRQLWDLVITYHWLKKEFIPEVLRYFKKAGSNNQIVSDGKKARYQKMEQIDNQDELLEFVKDIQETFYSYNQKVFLTKEIICNLYEAISLCLNRIPMKDYSKIKKNLKIEIADSLEQIIQQIDKRKQEIQNTALENLAISNLISCLIIPLRTTTISYLKGHEIKEIIGYLSSLYREKQLIDYIMKYKK